MYIKKINGKTVEYKGLSVGRTEMIRLGWIFYDNPNELPIERISINPDGSIIELPEPAPVNVYGQWYKQNPDLISRVREYATALDDLSLPHTAKTEEIASAISALPIDEPAKITKILMMQTAFQNIVLNIEYLGIDRPQYRAWAEMPELIAALPEIAVS